MYKKVKNEYGEIEENIIQKIDSGTFIPMIEGNRDYQEYLEWVAEGNTPEPADE